jgi:LysM repeat protein
MLASTLLVATNRRIRAVINSAVVASLVALGSMDYVVKQGDTLTSIARQHDVTVSALVEANSLANPDLIRVGQRLVLPGGGGDGRVHVVVGGETLAGIASRYRVSLTALARANDIGNPNRIRVGQRLVVPGGGHGSDAAPTVEYHVVARGETLSSIAARYGLTVRRLAEANGIIDTSTIYVGTRLALSGTAFVAPGASGSGPSTHTVAAGETLSSIARRYGVGVGEIAAANGIADPNRIRIGQTLTIPGGKSWVCPVESARYFNDWGFPRSGGRFHQGNDLFAPRGTPVRAPVAGEVRHITGTLGGLQFHLAGVDGVTYVGTHMDAFGKAGRVAAGDVIGYVGDSGNARGSSPHLHFEMHPGGVGPVNPYPTLQRAGC